MRALNWRWTGLYHEPFRPTRVGFTPAKLAPQTPPPPPPPAVGRIIHPGGDGVVPETRGKFRGDHHSRQTLDLTTTEFKLLWRGGASRKKPSQRDFFARKFGGYKMYRSRTVDTHCQGRLREKKSVGGLIDRPMRGEGYRFMVVSHGA